MKVYVGVGFVRFMTLVLATKSYSCVGSRRCTGSTNNTTEAFLTTIRDIIIIYSLLLAARTPRRTLRLLHPRRPPPSPLSANCTSLPPLARHEGTGMQTALIMTFTVYATVWSGEALRPCLNAHTELARPRWGLTTATCPLCQTHR